MMQVPNRTVASTATGSATPPRLFRFRLPESEFAVPANELLDEEPIGEDAKFYLKIENKYVRVGRTFQPVYYDRFHDWIRTRASNRTELNKTKDGKYWKEKYKNDFDTYEKSLKIAKDEKKAAEEALKEKNNELQRWQKTHSQLVRLHARNELEADFDYSMHLVESEKAKQEYESLAKKVNKLRSEAEAFNITEREVKDGFNQLCTRTLTGCLGLLTRYINPDRLEEIQNLASMMSFERADGHATLLGSGFGKYLLGLILDKSRDEYLLRLSQWWTEEPQDISSTGIHQIDADMARKVLDLQDQPPVAPTPRDKKHRREQRFDEIAQRKAMETMEMYLRWRADTARLQLRLFEEKPQTEHVTDPDSVPSNTKVIASHITRKISQEFFETLLSTTAPAVTDPVQLFEREGEDAAKRLRQFEQKLYGCVETATDLYRYMRRSKAHWSFDWVESNAFDLETMDFCEEQKLRYSIEELRMHAKRGEFEVLYCITPALAKYGDDDGHDFRRRKILQPAQVVVDLISMEHPGVKQEKQAKDQVVINDGGNACPKGKGERPSTDTVENTHVIGGPESNKRGSLLGIPLPSFK